MDEELKQHLQQKSTWLRALYMVLFAVIFGLLEIIIATVVIFQFILTLLTGNTNERLLKLGQSLSTYLYQIAQFLMFNSDNQPYPFGTWPKGAPTATKTGATQSKPKASAPKKSSKTSKTKTKPAEKA